MFQNTPSDKVQFRALGELPAPGTCLVCGNGTCEEGYVDLGTFIEYVGAGLLCAICLTQCAELIGMMTKEEVMAITKQAEGFLNDLTELRTIHDAAQERLDHYDAAIKPLLPGLFSDDFNSASSPLEVFESVVNGSEDRESEVAESDSSEGLTDAGTVNEDAGILRL